MQPVEWIYASSRFHRQGGVLRQELSFCLSVANIAGDKQVAVVWAEDDGRWHELAATYRCPSGDGRELWLARCRHEQAAGGNPPAAIRFAARCTAAGRDCWDNNGSRNYTIAAGCGIALREGRQVALLDPVCTLGRWQEVHPVRAAAAMAARPQEVEVRWTTDGWATSRTTPCCFRGRRGSRERAARHADRGPGIWTAPLPVHDAFRIEYALACRTGDGTVIWDSNLGRNYRASRPPLSILTLNLHCYQEDNQDAKFSRIAAAVHDLDIDLVCLQEVGELWNGGRGDWHSNAAKIIRDRLGGPYHIMADWSHIGFDRYREGSAILSRYPFLICDSGYVSAGEAAGSIHSRKVCMVRVQVPAIGLVNLFCVHLSWWDEGFQDQFETLCAWAQRWHDATAAATLLCGDFNVATGSAGYRLALRHYDDQYRAAGGADDGRIDHILMKRGSRLKAVAARALFTQADYGTVSDHCGYCVAFEPV